jgi:chromate transporter
MMSAHSSNPLTDARPAPSVDLGEIFRVFLRLGLTSFGGPIAHLGYFRAEFVERRHWLSEQSFADLVALSQFLPGPASSQTGFGVGLLRGGFLGGLAAWAGFTLPSAILMILFAYGAGGIADSSLGAGLLHGSNSSPWRSWRKPSWEWREPCALTTYAPQSRPSR